VHWNLPPGLARQAALIAFSPTALQLLHAPPPLPQLVWLWVVSHNPCPLQQPFGQLLGLQVHCPCWHDVPGPHGLPHAPQLELSFEMSTHLPLHLESPLHVKSHPLAPQISVAPEGGAGHEAVHDVPHAFCGVDGSHAFVHFNPLVQSKSQLPLLQNAVAPDGGRHADPQTPP